MEMPRLNIRHSLPQTDLRIRHGSFDNASYVPARVSTNQQQARSNKTVSQPSLQLDNYPSRKSWGARNLTDLTREFGQKGLSDVQAGTSRRTQIAWERAESGGKPGNDIKQEAQQKVHGEPPETLVEIDLMEGPIISITPVEVIGEPDLGDVTAEIDTADSANVHYTKGSTETYLKDKGFIRRWLSMGEYDIYA